MTATTRRFALLAALTASVLSACTNPLAPSANQLTPPSAPSTDGAYAGGVGRQP